MLLATAALTGTAHSQQATPAAKPSFAALNQPVVGLPAMPKPDGYVATRAMFELGQRLFHDGILSKDHSVSCASCHLASNGFAHPDQRPPGVAGKRAKRHAPSLFNRGYSTLQRWDGSSKSLEAFVLEPIADPDEMALSIDIALTRLRDHGEYASAFRSTFDSEPNATTLQRSLATFVRGIVRGDAPYDRFLRGDPDAMTAEQRHGQWVFESKGGCWKCHTPPLFSDERFHNTGVGLRGGKPEPGRMAVTGKEQDRGKWKTPTLRGVALTAPFMHDGSLATLEEVIAFYMRGGNANAQLDHRMQTLDLSEADQRALLAFLRSL